MSLGAEPFELDIMDRPPRPRDEPVITLVSASVIFFQGLVQSMLTIAVYIFAGANATYADGSRLISPSAQFLNASHPDQRDQQTIAFLTLTVMQLVQSFLSRSVTESVFKTGIFGNRWMVGAFVFSFLSLVASAYIPGMDLS